MREDRAMQKKIKQQRRINVLICYLISIPTHSGLSPSQWHEEEWKKKNIHIEPRQNYRLLVFTATTARVMNTMCIFCWRERTMDFHSFEINRRCFRMLSIELSPIQQYLHIAVWVKRKRSIILLFADKNHTFSHLWYPCIHPVFVNKSITHKLAAAAQGNQNEISEWAFVQM